MSVSYSLEWLIKWQQINFHSQNSFVGSLDYFPTPRMEQYPPFSISAAKMSTNVLLLGT